MNQYTNGKFDQIANAIKIIDKYNPDWEYAGGFTNTDSPILIRCRKCGDVTKRSMVTIRHQHCRCRNCESQRLQSKKAQKQMRYASLLFNAGNQMAFKFCGCGALIPSNKHVCSECVKRRAMRYMNAKKERRRVQALTKESSQISVQTLYERDCGVCWICGEPCRLDVDYNDNYYPSIDHLLPISKGGKDEWSNVRLAHRICNSLRGNRVEG